jgi:hypothetical protein
MAQKYIYNLGLKCKDSAYWSSKSKRMCFLPMDNPCNKSDNRKNSNTNE